MATRKIDLEDFCKTVFADEFRKKDYHLKEYKKNLIVKQIQNHVFNSLKTISLQYSSEIEVYLKKDGIEVRVKKVKGAE